MKVSRNKMYVLIMKYMGWTKDELEAMPLREVNQLYEEILGDIECHKLRYKEIPC